MKYRVTFPVNFFLYNAKSRFMEMRFSPGTYIMVEAPHPLGMYFEKRFGKWICIESTLIGMCYNAFVMCATEMPEHFRIKVVKIEESKPTKQKE